MDYTADIRYRSTKEPVFQGISNGEGRPRYEFADDLGFDEQEGLWSQLEVAYEEGLYGTGSPGQVRDMLMSMQYVVDLHEPFYELVIPRDTRAKSEREAKADEKAVGQFGFH